MICHAIHVDLFRVRSKQRQSVRKTVRQGDQERRPDLTSIQLPSNMPAVILTAVKDCPSVDAGVASSRGRLGTQRIEKPSAHVDRFRRVGAYRDGTYHDHSGCMTIQAARDRAETIRQSDSNVLGSSLTVLDAAALNHVF